MGDTPWPGLVETESQFQAVILDRCVALSIVVSPVGLEPTVYRLEVCCIIQLCYGNKYRRWDSNPYWTDFKSVVSAYWTTAAKSDGGGIRTRISHGKPANVVGSSLLTRNGWLIRIVAIVGVITPIRSLVTERDAIIPHRHKWGSFTSCPRIV